MVVLECESMMKIEEDLSANLLVDEAEQKFFGQDQGAHKH